MLDYNHLSKEQKQTMLNNRLFRKNPILFRDHDLVSMPEEKQPFIPLPYSLLDNESFRNHFMKKKRFRTYLWLCRRIVRRHIRGDPLQIYENYFIEGKLAVSIRLDRLAKELDLPKSTVSDHVNQLEKDGLLIIETAEGCEGQKQNIYILGTHEYQVENYFVNDVFKKKGE